MNQIKFTCKLESLQEDAVSQWKKFKIKNRHKGAIVVSEGELVADDEFKLNLQDVLQ